MFIDFIVNTMLISGVIFVLSLVVVGILGEKSEWLSFCVWLFLGSLTIAAISTFIVVGHMIYYNFVGPNYDVLNSKIYQVEQLYKGLQNKEEQTNEDYLLLTEAINEYNTTIDTYKHKYNKVNAQLPAKFYTYNKMVFNFANNTIMWEDGTNFN